MEFNIPKKDRIMLFLFPVLGFVIGIFFYNMFFTVSSIELSLSDVINIVFTAALVYFASVQTRINEDQRRYISAINRPRLDARLVGDNGQIQIHNVGNLPAFEVSIIVFEIEKNQMDSDSDFIEKPEKGRILLHVLLWGIFAKDYHEFFIPSFNELKRYIIEMSYYDNEEQSGRPYDDERIIQ